mmetsp:Transcript_4298/g.9268  ORF Transcript_4298/g.9268 Transcript_4298/m.9268 type:complete len:1107 (-) Transcript_4298:1229-4549(-)
MSKMTHIAIKLTTNTLFFFQLIFANAANWAQLAGERAQNTATPYIPDKWHRNQKTSVRPMWSARWGHALVVLNQAVARSYLTEEENSARAKNDRPVLVLLGGDDGLFGDSNNNTQDMGIGSGKLRNDVWIGELAHGSQTSWRVDDKYFNGGNNTFNPGLIRSEMRWFLSNPGRIAPQSWPSESGRTTPLYYDEWIACQDSMKDDLIDPTICDDPPTYCFRDILLPGCQPQAIWKEDNMWSPRRGHGAVVANNKIFLIGGRAREQNRIDETRLVGGIDGHKRFETMKDHSTIREDLVLKNDIWISEDGSGSSWTLVNPGCRDPQEEVLMQSEVWSRDLSEPSLPKIVGTLGSKCYRTSDCYGISECRGLGNTHEKVCVCPMFSPREHHSVAVQHRFKINDDSSVFAEDVIYVVGGFINVKHAFCSNRSCGPSDGYRLAIDDAWMSSDGRNWFQFKPAFSLSFVGRGGHTSLIVRPSYQLGNVSKIDGSDRLLILGGEALNPYELNTTYLNDVWEVALPTEPCCVPSDGCTDESRIHNESCLPSATDWEVITHNSEWPARAFHTSVYEPSSSSNQFLHRIYLMGGKNATRDFSDVWTWNLANDAKWQCDFCSDDAGIEEKHLAPTSDQKVAKRSATDAYLCIDSPLSSMKKFGLPSLDKDTKFLNYTPRSTTLLLNDTDIATAADVGVTTIKELASADLYRILKLRGFDYPGIIAREIRNVCYLRAISLAFVKKCAIEELQDSFFHQFFFREAGHANDETSAISCGRGGNSNPCDAGDWDGCTPIPGLAEVDVHGLGNVAVPQIKHNVSSVVEELFCRRIPRSRCYSASAFLDNRVVTVGGKSSNSTTLYRDVWTRDETFPRAFISLKPKSRTSQSKFVFDSSEAGAYFEYKIIKGNDDIIPWSVTTKSMGVDVSWIGRGWYTLFVRSVDPSGNRDVLFSNEVNVFSWYYVPPIPWGVLSGCALATLALVVGGYFEYRRRKRRAVMERFTLRRMRRKFKLKSNGAELTYQSSLPRDVQNIDKVVGGHSTPHQSRRSSSLRNYIGYDESQRKHESHLISKVDHRSNDNYRSGNVRRRRKQIVPVEVEAKRRRNRNTDRNRSTIQMNHDE